jgi:ADP-heptose:LPS heptosyltransferase
MGPEFTVVAEGDPLPPFDLRCPVMSLPLAFGTTLENIPAPMPYLFADPERVTRWRERLGPGTRPRVGLFWAGNQSQPSRLNRSIPFDLLAPLLELPLAFHALQKEVPPQEEALLRMEPRLDRHPEAEMDFPGTAALIEAMDLVVSVDSSMAHLAGAMGKPVWILLPFAADFRWLLDRRDSPWYPTATLFRQPARGDWPSVLGDVAGALMEHLAG